MKSFWKSHFLTLILVFGDVVFFCLIWRAAHFLRHALDPQFSNPINAWESYGKALFPQLLLLWIAVMTYFEHYAHLVKISSLNQIGNIIKAGIGLLVGTMAIAFLMKGYDLGRSVILLAAAGMTLYVYVSRTALRLTKQYFVARGHGLTRVAIIGAGNTGKQVAARIKNHPEVGYELVGFIDDDDEKRGRSVDDVPVIGNSEHLVDLLLRYRVEEGFLAVPSMPADARSSM